LNEFCKMLKRVFLFAALSCLLTVCFAQNKPLPVLKTNKPSLDFRMDAGPYRTWTVIPEVKPDILDVPVTDKPVKVVFKSETDSVTFMVTIGQVYNFIVLVNGKDSAYTQVKGQKFVKPATFSKTYIKKKDKRTSVEIPAVYELVNIVYALTPSGQQNENFVYTQSSYYTQVRQWFDKFQNAPIVACFDSALKQDGYFSLKMDAYAFEFSKRGKITQSKTYDRVSWGNKNTLRPYIPQLQQFARESGFALFFKEHQNIYQAQISCYRDSINTADMVNWLRQNFPTTTYNAFKIIFSPLVSWNQSANRFEDNGFKEAQAHVNFPYIQPNAKKEWSAEALNLIRGSIVFTEINHSFINPELEKHFKDPNFEIAFTNLDVWLDKNKAAGSYYNPVSAFNEYMNWGLVSLYEMDRAPKADLNKMIQATVRNMQNRSGFKKFDAFNTFLIDLYQNRPPNKTLADLYPQIITWFAQNKG